MRLFKRPPKTEAELEAFVKEKDIKLQYAHFQQLWKEIKLDFKLSKRQRQRPRRGDNLVFFRRTEEGDLVFVDERGSVICETIRGPIPQYEEDPDGYGSPPDDLPAHDVTNQSTSSLSRQETRDTRTSQDRRRPTTPVYQHDLEDRAEMDPYLTSEGRAHTEEINDQTRIMTELIFERTRSRQTHAAQTERPRPPNGLHQRPPTGDSRSEPLRTPPVPPEPVQSPEHSASRIELLPPESQLFSDQSPRTPTRTHAQTTPTIAGTSHVKEMLSEVNARAARSLSSCGSSVNNQFLHPSSHQKPRLGPFLLGMRTPTAPLSRHGTRQSSASRFSGRLRTPHTPTPASRAQATVNSDPFPQPITSNQVAESVVDREVDSLESSPDESQQDRPTSVSLDPVTPVIPNNEENPLLSPLPPSPEYELPGPSQNEAEDAPTVKCVPPSPPSGPSCSSAVTSLSYASDVQREPPVAVPHTTGLDTDQTDAFVLPQPSMTPVPLEDSESTTNPSPVQLAAPRHEPVPLPPTSSSTTSQHQTTGLLLDYFGPDPLIFMPRPSKPVSRAVFEIASTDPSSQYSQLQSNAGEAVMHEATPRAYRETPTVNSLRDPDHSQNWNPLGDPIHKPNAAEAQRDRQSQARSSWPPVLGSTRLPSHPTVTGSGLNPSRPPGLSTPVHQIDLEQITNTLTLLIQCLKKCHDVHNIMTRFDSRHQEPSAQHSSHFDSRSQPPNIFCWSFPLDHPLTRVYRTLLVAGNFLTIGSLQVLWECLDQYVECVDQSHADSMAHLNSSAIDYMTRWNTGVIAEISLQWEHQTARREEWLRAESDLQRQVQPPPPPRIPSQPPPVEADDRSSPALGFGSQQAPHVTSHPQQAQASSSASSPPPPFPIPPQPYQLPRINVSPLASSGPVENSNPMQPAKLARGRRQRPPVLPPGCFPSPAHLQMTQQYNAREPSHNLTPHVDPGEQSGLSSRSVGRNSGEEHQEPGSIMTFSNLHLASQCLRLCHHVRRIAESLILREEESAGYFALGSAPDSPHLNLVHALSQIEQTLIEASSLLTGGRLYHLFMYLTHYGYCSASRLSQVMEVMNMLNRLAAIHLLAWNRDTTAEIMQRMRSQSQQQGPPPPLPSVPSQPITAEADGLPSQASRCPPQQLPSLFPNTCQQRQASSSALHPLPRQLQDSQFSSTSHYPLVASPEPLMDQDSIRTSRTSLQQRSSIAIRALLNPEPLQPPNSGLEAYSQQTPRSQRPSQTCQGAPEASDLPPPPRHWL